MNTGGQEITVSTVASGGGASQSQVDSLQAEVNQHDIKINQLEATVGPGGTLDGGTF